jgi:predicted membrane protein
VAIRRNLLTCWIYAAYTQTMSGYDKWARRRDRQESSGSITRSPRGGFVFGIIVIVAGTVMLLDNLGILRARDFWDYAPLILAALGIGKIAESRNRPAPLLFGGLLAAVGTLWFLRNMDVLQFDVRLIWPVIIIGFGVFSLMRAMERQRYWTTGGTPPVSEAQVQMFAVFGGSKRVIDAPDFRGADVFAMFGGVELDLRPAGMVTGASIDANAIFGGVEIKVPLNWAVEIRGTGIFGGYEDKTIHPALNAQSPAPKLIVTGAAVFGGVSVSNA